MGFDVTESLPWVAYKIDAKRRYPNIPDYNCSITYVIGRDRIRFFYLYADYRDKNWEEGKLNKTAVWKTFEETFADKEKILQRVVSILENFDEFILDSLRTMFEAN